jgi:subtilisin family serine protease
VALLRATDPVVARRTAQELASELGLRVFALYDLRLLDATLVVFDIVHHPSPRDVPALLRQRAEVIDADGNTSSQTQNDPHAPRQYALRMTGVEQVHASLRGRGILIGLVDAAVDVGHEDLAGAIASSEDLVEGGGPMPQDLHGTAVAGLIGARRDNRIGIAGVAPEARLMALRACVSKGAQSFEGECAAHRVARGIDLAYRGRVHILNLSLGGPHNRIVTRMVQAALGRGMIVVAAAGNNGPSGPALYPAAIPGVLAVGATDARDRPYERSNLRPYLAIMAPGVDVMTTLPSNRYAFVTGTSYAAAHVSGALALLMEGVGKSAGADPVAPLRDGAAQVAGLPLGRLDLCGALALAGRAGMCPQAAGQRDALRY